jgi:hypothetical protein
MQKVKRDQLWDSRRRVVPRARRQRAIRSREPFFHRADAVKGNAMMVTLGEMKNSEKFRFVAEGGEPPA